MRGRHYNSCRLSSRVRIPVSIIPRFTAKMIDRLKKCELMGSMENERMALKLNGKKTVQRKKRNGEGS